MKNLPNIAEFFFLPNFTLYLTYMKKNKYAYVNYLKNLLRESWKSILKNYSPKIQDINDTINMLYPL